MSVINHSPTADTRNIDLLEATYRRTMPIVGLVRSYLVASTLTSVVGLLIAAIAAVSAGGPGPHRTFMSYVAVIGLLFVATALIQRMSRWVGIVLVNLASLGLIVLVIWSAVGLWLHFQPVPEPPQLPGVLPRPPQQSVPGIVVEATVGVTVSAALLIGIWRSGWLLARTDALSRAICADQFSAAMIGRPAVLASFGVPASILNAGPKRAGMVFLFWLSSALFALGLLLLLLSAIGLFGTAMRTMAGRSGTIPLLLLALGLAPVGALFVWAAGRLRRRARARLRMSIQEVQGQDERACILFLRAFHDDQVTLPPSRVTPLGRLLETGQRAGSLDALLLEEGTEFGPVVALGNPNDPIAPYGAARGYFDHADWKEGVSRLADAAQAIVICVEDSEGVWWEVENLLAGSHFTKTLFLIDPKFVEAEKNRRLMEQLIARVPELAARRAELLNAALTPSVVLGFFSHGRRLAIGRSSTCSRFAYLLMLRWFLRSRGPLLPAL